MLQWNGRAPTEMHTESPEILAFETRKSQRSEVARLIARSLVRQSLFR